jgi:putative peptide zinc metalloprotease protein
VSTILFNANPLLRYDGYYILSDLMEVPNLRAKASSILNRFLRKWCLGIEDPEDPFLPKRNQALFALYTVASFFYRWFVLLSILFFLNKVFEPYGLKVLGQMIALASLYGLVVMPFVKVYKFFRVPGRWSKVKKVRMAVTLALLAALVSGAFWVPFPSSVLCPFELQPRDATSVYVEVQGKVEAILVKPGDQVAAGDLLLKMSNIDLEIEIAQLRGERAATEEELDTLEQVTFNDRNATLRLDAVRESLASIEAQLEQKERDADRLKIKAPVAGTIIPPPLKQEPRSEQNVNLTGWSGSPLEKFNLGATLSPDEQHNLVCQIGDPDAWDAVLVIDQRDTDLVLPGQAVRLLFEEWAYQEFKSQIDGIADDAMEGISPRLASTSGGVVPAQADPDGVVRPLGTSYQANVPLDNSLGLFRNGLVGQARIQTEPRTLASRLGRYLRRTFRLDL